MCTVSFINSKGKIIITSNRDEQVIRPNAIEPKSYLVNNKTIFFPKDTKAGGTWYAIDEDGTVLVLLNGAVEKHTVLPLYRKSRGLIVLDIISNLSPFIFWHNIDLDSIEPFTLVLFENKKLYLLRWDGFSKETSSLDSSQNYIWSSATLYSKEIREARDNLFYNYVDIKSVITEQEILNFHLNSESNDNENGFVINRFDTLKTLSVTQTVIQNNKAAILHCDLLSQKDFVTSFRIV